MKSASKLVAKAALFNAEGKVLILTRSKTDKVRPGEFDFPGGRLDIDESPDEAVIREIREEVGIELSPQALNMAYSATTFYDNESTIRFLYVGSIGAHDTPKLSHEHDHWQWMALEDVFKTYDHPVWVSGLKYVIEHNLLQ